MFGQTLALLDRRTEVACLMASAQNNSVSDENLVHFR